MKNGPLEQLPRADATRSPLSLLPLVSPCSVLPRLKCGLAETLQVTPWFASLLLSHAWKKGRVVGKTNRK